MITGLPLAGGLLLGTPSAEPIVSEQETRHFIVGGLNGHEVEALGRAEDPSSPFAIGYQAYYGTRNEDELEYARNLADDLTTHIQEKQEILHEANVAYALRLKGLLGLSTLMLWLFLGGGFYLTRESLEAL